MRSYRSITAGGNDAAARVQEEAVPALLADFPVKFWWFATREQPYVPHTWQYLFHGANVDGKLQSFRHLVAGRRGGKTLSAAWEVLFYALHPSEFHRDVHGIEGNHRPLWIWCLAKDYQAGRPSLLTFLEVLNQAGLVKDRDFKYNKAAQTFEFHESGTLVEFKTGNDPQSLRGAGLDILWIDEAAFLPNKEAWDVVRPALSDREGIVITTTTPWGKNWFYEAFFVGEVLKDTKHFRVEYTSLDNPYFKRERWEYEKKVSHPVHFAQEFLAAFDAMAGIALPGDWLKYYVFGNPDTRTDDISVPREGDRYKLDLYIGVDPAISVADDADDFAMALIGVDKDKMQVYLLDYYLGHIAFPDQIDKLQEWHQKWRPQQIGVESNAFQRALEQQANRLAGFPVVIPVFSKGKKEERILSMAPLFRIGKIRIHKQHAEFIDQWVSFDPEVKNQKDDLLDAVEIALGVASVLLPASPHVSHFDDGTASMEEHAREVIRQFNEAGKHTDPDLGEMA